ncbi:polysaccharide lyase family 7 protein [Saccharothrix sp. S26]|uniref:polysaccharide lyase family 7 protein n=1 Tax=Saccharothrix sp. S26 TaxID=2907215 RepID=UPI002277ABFA|nr:polysaccharide lyase family 7 protein [Saccharothrix sp. S26]
MGRVLRLLAAGAVGVGVLVPVGAGAGAVGCDFPAQVLDLRSWKVQLPIGGEEDPDEVKQPALATYRVDPWFVVDPGCQGVRFRAAVDGVTTSGSKYPRSELREMNGTANAAWSSTSGTHVMTVDQTVTRLPNDKQHLVVGQIHGGDDDISVFRVEGRNLYVTNGDDAHYKLVTDDFRLNTRFQVKFVVSGGKINAYYNGTLAATLSASFSTGYFKAGAYTQANCGNSSPCSASNYGETIIHNVVLGDSTPQPPTGDRLPVSAVTASGDDGNVPGNTLDGDLSTRWSDEGDGVWIRYDLGSARPVGSVRLAWHKGDTRRHDFRIQTSSDGTRWTPVFSGSSSGTTLQPETYDIPDTTARYVRVVGYGNTGNDWTSISETTIHPPA